jgi:hypothetical protein
VPIGLTRAIVLRNAGLLTESSRLNKLSMGGSKVKIVVPYEIHEGKIVNIGLNLSEEFITDILVLWLSARIVQACMRSGILAVIGNSEDKDLEESSKVAIYNAHRMHDMVRDDSTISKAMFPLLNMLGADALIENIKASIQAFQDDDDNTCHCPICSAVREIMVENDAVPVTVGQVLKCLVTSAPHLSELSTSLDWVRLGEVIVNDDLSDSERDRSLLSQLSEVASGLGSFQHKAD